MISIDFNAAFLLCFGFFFVGFCLHCFEDIWKVHVSPCNYVLSKLICSVMGFNYHGFGISALIRVLRLQAGHKYCLLGRLSSEVGWNHYDTIRVRFEFFYIFASDILYMLP